MKYQSIHEIRPGQKSLIVFVNEGCIGDELMKIPFFYALRQRYADYHITWLTNCETAFMGALRSMAHLFFDAIVGEVGFQKKPMQLLSNPFRSIPCLQRRFDLIIDTQTNVLCTLVLKKIPHDRMVTGSAKFLLSDYRPEAGYQRPVPMTERCCALVGIASGKAMPPIYQSLPLAKHDDMAEQLLPAGPCYIGLAPGAGHPTRPKKWPLDRYIQVAQEQVKMQRVPVFFLGPNERDWYEPIHAQVPEAMFPEREISDRSLLGPLMVMALAKRLHAAVSNDCGTGHMLAAGNVPMVSLFGPTNAVKFAPCTERKIVLRAQQWGSDRMEAIPVEAVLDALAQLLAKVSVEKSATHEVCDLSH